MDETPIASVSISGSDISIEARNQNMTGVVKKDKRKYYRGSSLNYVIKFSDDGFKLRDHNEDMLWKVKYYEDKIKISNNEEMNNAYEVKMREAGKIKLERNESTITDFHISTDKESWVSIEGKYKIKGFGLSLASGVVLIPDLKDDEKAIIMAELSVAGK